MITYLIANWKANKTITEAKSWINSVASHFPKLSPNIKVVICPSLIHLHLFQPLLSRVALGVQDLSPYPDGAYTGAVSARMLENLTSFSFLGHSERRNHFKETNSEIALKVDQAFEYQITPILAVSQSTWRAQLNQIDNQKKSKLVILYEPPEAISKPIGPIGQGDAAPILEVVKAIKEIKQSSPSPVIYGGSIKSHNTAEFLRPREIDGLGVGSASLNPEEFVKILQVAQKIRG